MKSLLLMRHAKSSWADEGTSDFERPLNDRGMKDAPRMGRLLEERELMPEVVIASSALRAMQTALAVAKAAGVEGAPILDDSLYLAGPDAYLNILSGIDGSVSPILMVGHNPGIAALVEELSGQPTEMPTATIAHIQFDISDWDELASSPRGKLVDEWRPRDLDD